MGWLRSRRARQARQQARKERIAAVIEMTPQQLLTEALREHLYLTYANVPPRQRMTAHWVMNATWLAEIKKIDASTAVLPYLADAQVTEILGLPIQIVDDPQALPALACTTPN